MTVPAQVMFYFPSCFHSKDVNYPVWSFRKLLYMATIFSVALVEAVKLMFVGVCLTDVCYRRAFWFLVMLLWAVSLNKNVSVLKSSPKNLVYNLHRVFLKGVLISLLQEYFLPLNHYKLEHWNILDNFDFSFPL